MTDLSPAALAQPEPVARKPVVDYSRVPEIATEAQIRAAAQYLVKKRHCDGDLIPAIEYAIARWGRPTIQPVPVSERLPGPEDCDKQGHVWAWRVYRPQDDDDGDFWMQIPAKWLSHIPFSSNWSHWLPAHALPTPEATNA
jgi:hypothetical protein